jgi:hypothetical protein
LENTILKMAKKRAQVDAVLTTFGLSDQFTQDMEEQATARREVVEQDPEATPEQIRACRAALEEIGATAKYLRWFDKETAEPGKTVGWLEWAKEDVRKKAEAKRAAAKQEPEAPQEQPATAVAPDLYERREGAPTAEDDFPPDDGSDLPF